MLIDVHAHALSENLVARMAANPGLGLPLQATGPRSYRLAGYGTFDPLVYDLEDRLNSLKARGVVLQLIGPPPPLIANKDKAATVEDARLINESTRWLVENGENLLAGLVVLPLGEPQHTVDELHRAIEVDGFVGVALSTSAGERPLDDPAFEPLFEAMERLEVLAFMHSTSSSLSATQTDYTLRTLVGWPTETTVAIARMVFAGVFERYPRLKLILSHGGGTLPNLMGRLDLGWTAPNYEANPACRAKISKPPSAYLKQLYYDTVVASPDVLDFVIRSFGSDHVLFGTDFPYEIGDAEGVAALPLIRTLPVSDCSRISYENARRLLGKYIPASLQDHAC